MGKRIVSVRLEEPLWEKLRDLAAYEDRTIASQISYMVRRAIDQKEQNQAATQKRLETRARRQQEFQAKLEQQQEA